MYVYIHTYRYITYICYINTEFRNLISGGYSERTSLLTKLIKLKNKKVYLLIFIIYHDFLTEL